MLVVPASSPLLNPYHMLLSLKHFLLNHSRYCIRISVNSSNIRAKNSYEWYIIKIKIHSICEIEDFVETHLCKLCVILRSRALRVVCPH